MPKKRVIIGATEETLVIGAKADYQYKKLLVKGKHEINNSEFIEVMNDSKIIDKLILIYNVIITSINRKMYSLLNTRGYFESLDNITINLEDIKTIEDLKLINLHVIEKLKKLLTLNYSESNKIKINDIILVLSDFCDDVFNDKIKIEIVRHKLIKLESLYAEILETIEKI